MNLRSELRSLDFTESQIYKKEKKNIRKWKKFWLYKLADEPKQIFKILKSYNLWKVWQVGRKDEQI